MNKKIEHRLINAFAMQQKGLLAEAEREYVSIIQTDVDNVHAYNLLGVVCLNTGRPLDAEAYLLKAIELDSEDADSHANLCLAYKALGKIELAESAIRVSLKLEPERAASLAHLGGLYLDKRLPDKAVTHLMEALKRAPPAPEWLISLSIAFCELGQIENAAAAARHAVQLDPDRAEAYVALGDTLLKACQYSEALSAYKNAIAANRDASDAWVGLGTVLKEMGDSIEASRVLVEACLRFPNEPRCRFTLGTLYQQSGRASEAEKEFRAAIGAGPSYGAAYFQLLELPDATLDHRELKKLQKLAETGDRAGKSAHAHFAMARICEKESDFKNAMGHYKTGHQILGRSNPYDDMRTVKLFSDIQKSLAVSASLYESSSEPVLRPIFVVGMPRSGTTLVEQILSSHSEIGGAGESSFLEDCVRQAEHLTAQRYPFCINALKVDQLAQLRNKYLRRLCNGFEDKSHIVDKTPMNFQYVGLIRHMLPEARIIHCHRNALETCLSIFRLPFDTSQSYAHDLVSLGQFYRQYYKLMQHTEHLLSASVFPVDLDHLIDNSETILRDISAFVGLEFNDSMLRFHEAERVVRTPSALQVRKPLHRASKSWGDRFGEAAAPLKDALELFD